MKTGLLFLWLLCGLRVDPAAFNTPRHAPPAPPALQTAPASQSPMAQVKLLRITAMVDGSGRVVFTRDRVRYEHRSWSRPTDIVFDGEAWTDLDHSPAAWQKIGSRLDLNKAWIVDRQGRDTIALETTADGFDLYLCDAPNGSAPYSVTVAIPRRP